MKILLLVKFRAQIPRNKPNMFEINQNERAQETNKITKYISEQKFNLLLYFDTCNASRLFARTWLTSSNSRPLFRSFGDEIS